MSTPYQIRLACEVDLPQLVRLCADHARFEGAAPPGADLPEALAHALWGPHPRAWCLVVVAQAGRLVGYATYSREFATWTGRDFVHMDCLYLDQEHRRHGLGAQLLHRVAAAAQELGATEVQWQTPDWNTAAIKFYDRLGATRRPKLRYRLPVPVPVPVPAESTVDAGVGQVGQDERVNT